MRLTCVRLGRSAKTLLAAALAWLAAGCCESEHTIVLGEGVRIEAMSPAWVEGYAEASASTYLTVGVGPEGLIAAWFKTDTNPHRYAIDLRRPTTADLHDIVEIDGEFVAVGSGGTILHSFDAVEWAAIDLGLDADLWSVDGLRIDGAWWLLVAGDDALMVRDAAGTWHEPAPPPGGWGSLRASLTLDTLEHVTVGGGGVAWSTADPLGGWIAEDSGVTADLTIAAFDSCAAGTGGVLVCRDADGWRSIATGIDVDFAGASRTFALTVDGRLYTLEDDRLELVAEYDGSFTTLLVAGGIPFAAREGEILVDDPDACRRFE